MSTTTSTNSLRSSLAVEFVTGDPAEVKQRGQTSASPSASASPAKREDDEAIPPPDRHGVAWIIFAILGVGMLFPWNCFLTAGDYFNHVFPDAHFEFVMACVYNYPSILVLLLSVKYGSMLRMSTRIYFALAADLLVLICVPIIPSLKMGAAGLYVTLGCVFLTGIATAMLFGSVLGLAAFFPDKYTTAVMSGNGIAGVLAVVLRIITKVSLPETDAGLETSSTIYFALAASVLLLCLIAFSFLMSLPITRYYLRHTKEVRVDKQHSASEKSPLLGEASPAVQTSTDGSQPRVDTLAVFKQIWPSALSVCFNFLITLALFPGVAMLIEVRKGSKLPQDWFSLIMVTLFMVFDFIGRTIPRWVLLFNNKSLPIAVACRATFVALFILCIKPEIFKSEWLAFLFMALFAITNGYSGTLCMMFGPSTESLQNHERETAGTMMSFFLNLGVFLGANAALVILYAMTGSWGV